MKKILVIVGHHTFGRDVFGRSRRALSRTRVPARPKAKAIVCGVFLCCAAHAAAHAQPPPASSRSGEPTRLQGGLGVLGAVPSGDFAAHVDSAGGFLLQLDVGLGDSAFSLGGELAFVPYGSQSREVALGSLIPEIPNASVKVKTENLIGLLHARVRAQRREGRWRPYVDGLVGVTGLETTSSIELPECSADNYDCTLDEATNSEDLVFSYGAGAGVMIGFGSSPRSPRLDLSVRYIRGGEARYLTEGAIRQEGGRAILDFSRSRTDMFVVYVGVAFGR